MDQEAQQIKLSIGTKPARPNLGIMGFKDSAGADGEIDSPYRKKRGTLQSLKVKGKDDSNQDLSASQLLRPIFQEVLESFALRREEFEAMIAHSKEELAAKYKRDDLIAMKGAWIRSLEMQVPDSLGVDATQMQTFNDNNKAQISEIEQFINVASDWFSDAIAQLGTDNEE